MKSTRQRGKAPSASDKPSTGLVKRLESLLTERGLSERSVSLAADLGPTYVFDLLNGRIVKPTLHAMESIAGVLGMTLTALLDDVENNPTSQRAVGGMPHIGAAETGTYRAMPAQTSIMMLQRPLSASYPRARHFILTVGDVAMDAAGIPRGVEVLCVDMISAGIGVESKHIYAICRAMAEGEAYEFLIRRAWVYRDRTELVAESTRQDTFKKIVIDGQLTPNKSRQIFAIGLVYGTFSSFE